MTNIIGQLNDSGEWYTPHWIIDLVKEVLGEIDLDPASSPEANKYIKAKNIYTIKDDGLKKPWFGRVFVNSPYNNRQSPFWGGKLIKEAIYYPDVFESIALFNHNPGYIWYDALLYQPLFTPFLFKGLLEFIPADGQKATHAKRASSLFYYGENKELFKKVFRPYGKFLV